MVNVLPARRSGAVVSAMLHDPRVRKLSFTGSTEVGRVLLREAADQVVNCSMELGGNAPFLVFDDADLDAAVDGAMIAKMRNAGEACTAANRFYVHADVADEFSRRLAERMAALRVGPGTDDDTEVGPLVNDETRGQGRRAGAGRGRGRRQGRRRRHPPRSHRASTTSRPCCSTYRPMRGILGEEIFGPVAPIVTFTDEADAIRLANDTEFGLVSYVYTADLARGLRVSERSTPAWSASTAAWSATPPPRSAAPSRAASAARAATRACSTTWSPSTSPSPGDRRPDLGIRGSPGSVAAEIGETGRH